MNHGLNPWIIPHPHINPLHVARHQLKEKRVPKNQDVRNEFSHVCEKWATKKIIVSLSRIKPRASSSCCCRPPRATNCHNLASAASGQGGRRHPRHHHLSRRPRAPGSINGWRRDWTGAETVGSSIQPQAGARTDVSSLSHQHTPLIYYKNGFQSEE